jgi:2-methylcitrate dehydratase PrpD
VTGGAADELQAVAEYVADGDVSRPEWRDRARVLLADAMLLARAAHTVKGGAALVELGCGSGQHRSWLSDNRLGAADAVQANAAAICARFQDDTDMSSWAHPGSFVVPSAVAAAVEADRPLSAVLDGLVVGYTMTSWLGADGHVPRAMMSRGLRPSPSFAPAGAAAAASRALAQGRPEARSAFGGALLVARGTLHSVGSGGEDWRLHNPGAARDGFLYALAAGRGMPSRGATLTSPVGYLSVYTGSTEVPLAWQHAPQSERMMDVWHKALPTLGDNMAVALAARHLHAQLGGAVPERVSVRMNAHFAAFPGTQTMPPYLTVTSALASVRFTTAQLLTHGHLDLPDYDRRDAPDLVQLAELIDVTPDEGLDYTDAVVTVTVRGRELSCCTSDLPRTLFWRDPEEQRRIADGLLGSDGVALVDAVLGADEEEPASAVVDAALDSCPPQASSNFDRK